MLEPGAPCFRGAQELAGVLDFCLIDHLAVITLGTTLLGVDLIERRVCWKRNIFDESLPGQVVRPGMDGTVTVLGPSGQYVQRWGLVGPLGRGGLYVQSPSGLLAVDLITGQPRWQRTDVPESLACFGDHKHLFLLKMRSPIAEAPVPAVQRAWAVRARDGVAVAIPDALPVLNKRQRLLGHCVAASETGPNNSVVVRLRDLLTGKDLWTKTFPEKTVLLNSAQPELLAMAQPDGIVDLVDLGALRDGTPSSLPRQLLVERRHIQGQGGWLLRDHDHLYLALTGPEKPAGLFPESAVGHFEGELTSVPVDGMLYAFDRGNGSRRWLVPLPGQAILLNRFDELPLILCASVNQRQKDPMTPPVQVFLTTTIVKRTGKICQKSESLTDAAPYHTVLLDPRTGYDRFAVGRQSHPLFSGTPQTLTWPRGCRWPLSLHLASGRAGCG